MKLIDSIVELEKKKGDKSKYLFTLDYVALRNFEKRLFECDEFKSVVRLNYIEAPVYSVDEETEEPISSHREFLGGKVKYRNVLSFVFKNSDEIKFNKIVDIHSISIIKHYKVEDDIKKTGIWIYPTVYDDVTFLPSNQIRVIWDQAQLVQTLETIGSNETANERLLRMFKSALDSMEPNIPCDYSILIRCSPRSIINQEMLARKEPEVATFDFDFYIPITGMIN